LQQERCKGFLEFAQGYFGENSRERGSVGRFFSVSETEWFFQCFPMVFRPSLNVGEVVFTIIGLLTHERPRLFYGVIALLLTLLSKPTIIRNICREWVCRSNGNLVVRQ
jgi:hypothetical protein